MFYHLKKTTCYSIIICLVCAIFVASAVAENLRETPVVKAVGKVGPAVVNISVDYEVSVRQNFFGGFNDPFFDNFFQDFFDPRFDSKRTYTSLGSGVIIDGQKGLILTNAHVIETKGENKDFCSRPPIPAAELRGITGDSLTPSEPPAKILTVSPQGAGNLTLLSLK